MLKIKLTSHNDKSSQNLFKNHSLIFTFIYILIITLHNTSTNTDFSLQKVEHFQYQLLVPSSEQKKATPSTLAFHRKGALTTALSGFKCQISANTDNYNHHSILSPIRDLIQTFTDLTCTAKPQFLFKTSNHISIASAQRKCKTGLTGNWHFTPNTKFKNDIEFGFQTHIQKKQNTVSDISPIPIHIKNKSASLYNSHLGIESK